MKNIIGVIIVLLLVVALGAVGYWYITNRKQIPPAPTPPPSTQPTTQQAPAPKEKTFTTFPGILSPDQLQNKKAVIQLVTKGFFEIELYPDTPKATSNFITLAQDKFYNEKVFYKVTPGVKVDGGSKFVDGKDGVTYQFEDELTGRKMEQGSVAMVNIGPNTNSSRFFIVLGEATSLDPKYTVFGKVISGQELVGKIQEGDMIENITIMNR